MLFFKYLAKNILMFGVAFCYKNELKYSMQIYWFKKKVCKGIFVLRSIMNYCSF